MVSTRLLKSDYTPATNWGEAAFVAINHPAEGHFIITLKEYQQSFKAAVVGSSDGAWIVDVLGTPFYGAFDGRDFHGEYFSPETKFHEELLPKPPVFYYHGEATRKAGNDDAAWSAPLGEVVKRWKNERGGWFRVKLDPQHPKAPQLWDAAKAGNLYASSGVVPAKHRVCDADAIAAGECKPEQSGLIRDWLVGELSLIDLDLNEGRFPSNFYAIAAPAIKAFIPADQQTAFNTLFQPNNSKGVSAMGNTQKFFADMKAALLKMFTDFEAANVDVSASDPNAAENKTTGTANPDPDNIGFNGVKCAACGGGCGAKQVGEEMKSADNDAGDDNTMKKGGQSMNNEHPQLKAALGEIASLQAQLAQMQAANGAQADGQFIDEQILAGRIDASERTSVMELFSMARKADAGIKDGTSPYVEAQRKAILARAARFTFDNNVNGLKAMSPARVTDNTVDAAYMQRLRQKAGVKTTA